MNKKEIITLLIIFYVFFSFPILAQNNSEIDSLQTLLSSKNDDTTMIIILNELGWKYRKIDMDSSVFFANRALRENKDVYPKGLIRSYNTLGAIEYFKSNFYASIEYFKKALAVSYQIDSKKGIGSTANNIATLYQMLGDYDKSLKFNLQSLKIKEELNDMKGVVNSLQNISNLYYELNKFEEGIIQCERALLLARTYLPSRIARLLNTLGSLHNELGDYPKSLEYLNEALEVNKENNKEDDAAIILHNIANTYFEWGKYDLSMQFYLEALNLKEKIGDIRSLAKTEMGIGILAYEMGDYEKCVSYLNNAEVFFSESGKIFELERVYEYLAKAYYQLNQMDNAYKSLVKSIEVNDSLYTMESTEIIEELRTKYETEKKEQEIIALLKEKELQKTQSKNKTYFILILGLIILIIGVTVYFYFKNQKKDNLNKIMQERAKEAENQKNRFAKELHDGTGSNLNGIRHQLVALADGLNENQKISNIINEVEKTHQGVRLLAYQALAPEFDNCTLDEAIGDLVQRLTKTGTIKIHFLSTVKLNWLQTKHNFQLAIYRIVQEALSNIIKHSEAKMVEIQIIQHEGSINVMIEDDGKGFDVAVVDKGLGLRNINERAASLKGICKIDSTPGKGTCIIIEIPMPKNL